jgi:hypothetical protein
VGYFVFDMRYYMLFNARMMKIAQLQGDVRGLVFFFLYGMLLFLQFSFSMLIAYDLDESGMVRFVVNCDRVCY